MRGSFPNYGAGKRQYHALSPVMGKKSVSAMHFLPFMGMENVSIRLFSPVMRKENVSTRFFLAVIEEKMSVPGCFPQLWER